MHRKLAPAAWCRSQCAVMVFLGSRVRFSARFLASFQLIYVSINHARESCKHDALENEVILHTCFCFDTQKLICNRKGNVFSSVQTDMFKIKSSLYLWYYAEAGNKRRGTCQQLSATASVRSRRGMGKLVPPSKRICPGRDAKTSSSVISIAKSQTVFTGIAYGLRRHF